ncbi:MAG: hypothetical protein AB7Q00_14480 [Phycisphaerales bacterium]
MKSVTYVEIDLDPCDLVYGTAPCEAALGVTGTKKCFNTVKTCQDFANYDPTTQTLRFGIMSSHYPRNIDHIPLLRSVSFSGATISLGENLGQRATLTVSFNDGAHSDAGFDKYLDDRAYNPFKQGTFWGKFRARHPYLQGKNLRLIRGFLGQSLGEMRTRHYVIESFTGPAVDGTYTIIAKDVLKLADGDRAQAPLLSNGFLVNNINTSQTNASLSPTGIGNLEYPASGHVAISGTEVCAFTRSGDALTLTRGQMNTVGVAHTAQDRVQLVLTYSGDDPADIIADLLTNYTDIDPSFIPLSAWQLETATFLQRLYTANIAEPTSVNKLISEIIEQAALAMWWNDITRTIGLQVLRGVATSSAILDRALYVENSLSYREQPEKRLSQVWTYYGQRNPLRSVDDADNYVSSALTVDLEAEQNYGSAAIKKIFSRWIPAGGRSVALRVNDIQLGRYTDPPRKFNVSLFRGTSEVELAGGYILRGQPFQKDEGDAADVPIQVTSLNDSEEGLVVEAQEVLFKNFDPTDLSDRTIVIEVPTQDVNLRTLHDIIFPAPTDADVGYVTITCIIAESAVVSGTSTSSRPFDVGSWPVGLEIIIENHGNVAGAGGKGANRPGNPTRNGLPGGLAFYTRHPITLKNFGEINGGGGGGGIGENRVYVIGPGDAGYPGGGGAGVPGGLGGTGTGSSNGQNGTATAGGNGVVGPAGGNNGGNGGNGGGRGQPGQSGGAANNPDGINIPPGTGGAAGAAIDGHSYVTYHTVGTIRGPTIN